MEFWKFKKQRKAIGRFIIWTRNNRSQINEIFWTLVILTGFLLIAGFVGHIEFNSLYN